MAVESLKALENPFEKVPPQSLEAEQAVLGSILVDPDALLKAVEIVKPPDFYRNAHRYIYEAVLTLFDKGEPVDIVTVSEILKGRDLLDDAGGRSYINDLALAIMTAENIVYYAEIVRDKALLRELIHAGTEIVTTAYEEMEADVAIDKAEQLVFRLAQEGVKKDITILRDVLPDTYKRIEERFEKKGTLLGVSTGFKDLDSYTAGFQKSDLIILAARPSIGKTAFSLNIATHVAKKEKVPVLIFSLEMSKEQLVQRILCSEAEVDAQRIRMGDISLDQFPIISKAMGDLDSTPLYIDDSAGITLMEIRAKARKLKMECGDLGLIIIDYLQLIETRSNIKGGSSENRTQEISAISRGLKGIARELDVPVIALSQLSRSVETREDKRPMLSDLRESGSIEQDADIVIFLSREAPTEEEPTPRVSVIIAKQRSGPIGEVSLLFRPNTTKFVDLHRVTPEIF